MMDQWRSYLQDVWVVESSGLQVEEDQRAGGRVTHLGFGLGLVKGEKLKHRGFFVL